MQSHADTKLPMPENFGLNISAFMEAVECNGTEKAAEKMQMPHVLMLRRITDLETQLHMHLFYRTSKKFTLTPAGKLLQRQADQLLHKFQEQFLKS